MLGYFIPLTLILIYRVALSYPALAFLPPASWMMMGLRKYALLGFVTTMVLTTPLSRLPRKRDRVLVGLLMAALVFVKSVWPFLAPLADRRQLAHLQTRAGSDGVCRQTTGYTCGPASAVTGLRKLGLTADEGKIAILSYTSSTTGTEPDILADVLQNEYRKDGLQAEYRAFKDVAELRQAGLTLAVVKFNYLVDHFVTVLEVTDTEVIVGDPLDGLDRMTYDDFSKKWRFSGVVLKLQ
jgi:predicted double-glycine peptidase